MLCGTPATRNPISTPPSDRLQCRISRRDDFDLDTLISADYLDSGLRPRDERRASRIVGGLLFLLAAYIAVAATWSLVTRQGEAFTPVGFAVALLAIPIMYFLSRRKLAVADALNSRALRADAVESITCGWLALVVVIGLLVDLLVGAWWVDAVTSLVITWFVVKEAREAWNAEDCCD